MAVVIETTLGDLTVDLFVEERPRACLNFLKLCKLKYYNFNLFHNIEHDFIAQTGDPTGAGDGGESVWGVVEGFHKRYFEAESLPKIKHTIPGLLSMVSVGKNMVGSQFFFTLGSDLISLDGVHCVIGEVTEGHEVLRKLNEAIVDDKYRPYQDVRITHTVVLEDPFDDPRGFQIPSRSPSPSAERLKNGRIGADEDIDDTEGKTAKEIQEMLQEREAKARAIILEIVGDLPDAEIAPPENVLFVCKLNPVTTDDDLEIIFSRFGKVKCCEVIRDKLTGDSLQYAFVEFEDKKSCENAYFKMDNVLIDDRRIHVDFSQSVAKVKWRGKGRGVVRSDGKDGGKLDFNNLRQAGNSNDKSKQARAKHEVPRADRRADKGERRLPQQRPRSRSRSPQRNRSRSRSNESRSRSRRDQPSNRSETTGRDRRRSNSRSRNTSRRYETQNRDQCRPYERETRDREQLPRRTDHDRRSHREYDRRSRSRSPRNSRNRNEREHSPEMYNSRRVNKEPRDYHSQRVSGNRMRDYNRQNEKSRDDRYQNNDCRSNRSNGNSRARLEERDRTDDAKSIKRQHEKSSSIKAKKSKKIKKKGNSSSEDSDTTSSVTSSSSSEDERRKKSKKKTSKKRSKKKSRKRETSSSSKSSSDSSSD